MHHIIRRLSPYVFKAAVLVVGFAALALGGAQQAHAGIALNTIDDHATSDRSGARVRVTGPIACTRGERIAIAVRMRQSATGARARGHWAGRCTGEVQHWHIQARARGQERFADGRARVCAVGTTRAGAQVTEKRRWCRRVSVATAPKHSSWTRLLDRPISAERLGLPASAPASKLARAALRRSAGPLGLRGSMRGLQLLSVQDTPDLAGARDLRSLRFRQTVGGLRVLYSQIDVAVVDGSVTSISATAVPLKSSRLSGAKRISAAAARGIARRRIAGPDSALPAQAIAYAGRPNKPRAARRAWVVQVTPAEQPAGTDLGLNLCVVIDAGSGRILEVWKGVAARPRSAAASPAARAAQATETRLALIRDANFAPSVIGTGVMELYTRGNPYKFGDDDPGEGTQERNLLGAPLPSEINKVKNTVRVVGRHMCVNRGFCGRDGGFDGTVNTLSVTARAPTATSSAKTGRGTRYTHSDQRVYVATPEAGSRDIAAHEFGHLIDLTNGGDRIQGLGTDEVEEAVADMFAYDFDPNDPTLGEADSATGFPNGNPRINWQNPGLITSPTEHVPYPAHASQFKCNRKDPHFNSSIYSRAYFLFVQKVGREKAAAVLYGVSSMIGPLVGPLFLRDRMIQRADELFGASARQAATAAWTTVGMQPGNEVRAQGAGCFVD